MCAGTFLAGYALISDTAETRSRSTITVAVFLAETVIEAIIYRTYHSRTDLCVQTSDEKVANQNN